MSLPTRQQRVLDAIESALESCEPRMKAMFEMFARLSVGEKLTSAERLPRRRLSVRPGRLSDSVMLIPLVAVVLLMTGLVIGVTTGGASACGAVSPAIGAAARTAIKCATPAPRPLPLGGRF